MIYIYVCVCVHTHTGIPIVSKVFEIVKSKQKEAGERGGDMVFKVGATEGYLHGSTREVDVCVYIHVVVCVYIHTHIHA